MTTKITPVGSAFTFVAADDRGNTVTANQGGGGLLLTGATGGFFYVPGMTGAPASASGPTGYTGTVAHVFDVSNNMPWFLNPANTFGGSTGATPSWVAGNGQVLIQKFVVGGATGTVTFNNVPQVFNSLRIVTIARIVSGVSVQDFGLRFNGDSGNNYDTQEVYVSNATVGGALLQGVAGIRAGIVTAGSATANYPGQLIIDVPYYNNTLFFKTTVSMSSVGDSAAAANCLMKTITGIWRNTAAVSSVIIYSYQSNTFTTGSTFFIYGVW